MVAWRFNRSWSSESRAFVAPQGFFMCFLGLGAQISVILQSVIWSDSALKNCQAFSTQGTQLFENCKEYHIMNIYGMIYYISRSIHHVTQHWIKFLCHKRNPLNKWHLFNNLVVLKSLRGHQCHFCWKDDDGCGERWKGGKSKTFVGREPLGYTVPSQKNYVSFAEVPKFAQISSFLVNPSTKK